MHVISKDAIEATLRSMQHFKQHGEIPQQDRECAMADLVTVFGDDYIDERRITLMLTTAWERATKNCGGDRGGRVSGLKGALDLLVLSQCVSRHGASVRWLRVWRFTASLTCCQGAAFLSKHRR
jgi:hypothetical protein